ncbi:hypothetical protein AAFF_G00282170 [Aldrovandia affinis]|uniref:Uncharacterized protein n=1 Tax=Aldrovandia affinis TaxID=143900 RepID=A0AAD7T9R7_9TELE|nr:hypothetical protein AAFF_G00282170 [Aldrovandia affinis]
MTRCWSREQYLPEGLPAWPCLSEHVLLKHPLLATDALPLETLMGGSAPRRVACRRPLALGPVRSKCHGQCLSHRSVNSTAGVRLASAASPFTIAMSRGGPLRPGQPTKNRQRYLSAHQTRVVILTQTAGAGP